MNLRYVEHRQHKKRKEPVLSVLGNWVEGQQVCVTGKFKHPRRVIHSMIGALSGTVVNIINGQTDILITSDSLDYNSSKLVKARKQGVTIMREYQFIKIWNQYRPDTTNDYADF